MVSELWSGHEKLTDGKTDGGHDIIIPIFDERIKIKLNIYNCVVVSD